MNPQAGPECFQYSNECYELARIYFSNISGNTWTVGYFRLSEDAVHDYIKIGWFAY